MAPGCLFCDSVGRGLRKGTLASASLSVYERAVPQSLPRCQILQFHPCKLLPRWQSSEGMCLSKFSTGALRGTASESSSFFIDSNPPGFYSQKLCRLLFLALETWVEGPGVGLGPLAPEIFLPNFYPLHMGVRPTCFMFLCLCISYLSGLMWFLYFHTSPTSIQLNF